MKNISRPHSFPELRNELRRWAEAQKGLSVGPKAFLMHLANHADDQARAFVVSRHFQTLMNISPRSVTYYLRRLESMELIAPTGDFEIRRFTRLTLYRLAPGDDAISDLLGWVGHGAAAPARTVSNSDTRVSSLDPQRCRFSSTSNKYHSNDNKEDASPGAGVNASFGVQGNEPSLLPAMDGVPPAFAKAYLEEFENDRAGYLLHSLFCRETGTLYPRTEIAARRMREAAGGLLADWGIQIGPWFRGVANG